MSELILYNKAKQALAECKSFDEVKDIRDKAMALRLYAQQAKDPTMEEDAIEIRLRAERRCWEMSKVEQETGNAYKQGGDRKSKVGGKPLISLEAAGIDKNLAHRARILGRMSMEKFESYVALARKHKAISKHKIVAEEQGIEITTNTPIQHYSARDIGLIVNYIEEIEKYIDKYDRAELGKLKIACDRLSKLITTSSTEERKVVWLSSTK